MNKKIEELVRKNIKQIIFYKETSLVGVTATWGYGLNCSNIKCGNCIIYKVKSLYNERSTSSCWEFFNKILEVFNELPEEDKLEILVAELGE